MAFYADEEEVYKCPKHPSKRRRTCGGVCPFCLTDRLSALCPDCASARPCPCCPPSATSSSPSSSSSSRFSSDASVRVSSLIAGEPAFRRSSSVASAMPFLRSRFGPEKGSNNVVHKPSIWSFFRNKRDKTENSDKSEYNSLMTRSKSVAAGGATSAKKGWYFPSPMKAFRQTKSAKVVQERSPLYRG